jgi:peptidoglycan/LPS O-acetylase OafA/YrhL
VVVLLLTLVIADLSYRYVESPLRNFGRRLSKQLGVKGPTGTLPQPILGTVSR